MMYSYIGTNIDIINTHFSKVKLTNSLNSNNNVD